MVSPAKWPSPRFPGAYTGSSVSEPSPALATNSSFASTRMPSASLKPYGGPEIALKQLPVAVPTSVITVSLATKRSAPLRAIASGPAKSYSWADSTLTRVPVEA